MSTEATPANVGSMEGLGAGAEALCMCKDRALTACPGEWEPGCDLGNNEKFVVVHTLTSAERSNMTKRAEAVIDDCVNYVCRSCGSTWSGARLAQTWRGDYKNCNGRMESLTPNV